MDGIELEKVKSQRLAERVAEQIARAILNGTWRSGDRLPPERELARMLGVTRTSLREGLRRLEQMGMVAARQGGGNFITDVTREATLAALEPILAAAASGRGDLLRGLQEFRLLVQCEIARRAAERRTEEEAAQIERMADLMTRETRPSVLARLDWELACAIAGASRNVVFSMVLNSARHLHERWAPVYFAIPQVAERTARFQRLLARAIRRQRPDQAGRITRLLLAYSDPVVFDQLRQAAQEGAA